MSARGGSSSDMPAIPHFGNRQGLSAAAADGMLDGTGVSRQAPVEQQVLARVLNSAAAPPTARELSGETAAVAMFVLASREADSRRPVFKPAPRRMKLLVAGSVAALCVSVFGGAAAAGALPSHLQQMAHVAFGAPAPSDSHGHPGHPVRPTPTPSTSRQGGSPTASNRGNPGRAVGHNHSGQHGKAKGHSKSPSPGQGRYHKRPSHSPSNHSNNRH